ncbi:MAG: ATP-NAD kinase family protein [Alphaproteobacteria bacterium]
MDSKPRIGFLINPIAGMGGRVGLKGTDGVADDAARLGAKPSANERATEALRMFKHLIDQTPKFPPVRWLTAAGSMGEEALRAAGLQEIEIVHKAPSKSTRTDTIAAVQRFLSAHADLVLFCGGDGTARDVCSIAGERVPVLGIPAGVKMYSGVFGVTPERTAEILVRYIMGEIGLASADILDLDEEKYRRDEWSVRLYMSARTPFEPSYVQAAKAIIAEASDEAAKEEIAEHLKEEIAARPGTLFLLGPGSTLKAIGGTIGVDKTLLGIDAILGGRLIGKDLNEAGILALLSSYQDRKLVLSPIGAQGFVLGRGNLQLSPAVIRQIGLDNILIVATPAKLARTPSLRFDTRDTALDSELISRKFASVIIGYHRLRLVKLDG